MESLPKDGIIQFLPNTLEEVRKIYDLHKPGAMDQAIDILDAWVKQQNHFLKKDFSRDYLERAIILSKGSVERAKVRIDKSCTLRTLMPHFFTDFNIREDFQNNTFHKMINLFVLPKLTKDYYRVYMIKICDVPDSSKSLLEYYKLFIIYCEYLRAHDYAIGYIYVVDYTDINMLDYVKVLNLIDLRQMFTLLMDGYGVRIKGIHFLTASKLIDVIVGMFKQVLSAKVGGRIMVQKNLESLYEWVPKELLPKDYGGEQKSLDELHEECLDALSKEDFKEYWKEISKARTDEACRQSGTFNDQYMGMPGTFRALSVD